MTRRAHMFRGAALTAVAFIMVSAAPVAAQNTAPLAAGEVLLQLQQNTTLLEPIGSIDISCRLSASGANESAALLALAKKRTALTQQLSKSGIAASAIIDTGEPELTNDYDTAANAAADAAVEAAADAANAAAAAADAADAAGSAAKTMVTPSAYQPTKKATQSFSFRFNSYSQVESAMNMGQSIECGRYNGYRGRLDGVSVKPVDPEGASRRLQQQSMLDARKRADVYAAAMNMKVLRIQRVSEVSELSNVLGPDMPKEFFREAMTGRQGVESNLKKNKVELTEGLFIDFVLGPK